jgi:hypothetical protein
MFPAYSRGKLNKNKVRIRLEKVQNGQIKNYPAPFFKFYGSHYVSFQKLEEAA